MHAPGPDADEPAATHPARSDLRLLTPYLRAERRRLGALAAVLSVAVLLPVAAPILLGRAIDLALAGAGADAILLAAVAYIAVTLTGDALELVVTARGVRLAWAIGNRLRTDLAAHALSLDLTWHGAHSPGQLIERIDGDVDAVVRFTATGVLAIAGNAILLLGTLVAAVVLEWRAGLLIAVVAAATVLVMRRLRGLAVPAMDAEREVQGQLHGDVEERLGGLEDLRALGAGPHALHRLEASSADWWRTARRAGLLGDGAYAAAASTYAVGVVAVLALALTLHLRGAISLGVAVALLRYVQMVKDPLEAAAEQLSELQRAIAGTRRAARLLATRPLLVDGPGRTLPAGPLDVALDDVTFAYADDPGTPVLRDVSLRIPAGSSLGVVGRTGSGKTSLGRLLLRFADVTAGAVRIGGVDVRDTRQAHLRTRIGVVTQDVQVLRASVRDNLTLLGAVDADDVALRRALDDVGLGPWLRGLADGVDTPLDGAAGMSAGQAQLLALARILLTDPGVVVLDEATSRLDPATEALVTRATERALAGRTVVVIAHRLETLARVDAVAVVEAGRLVEHGPRDVLAADPDSRFGAMVRRGAADAALVEELT